MQGEILIDHENNQEWNFFDIHLDTGNAYYRDIGSDTWIDNQCFIKEDGKPNIRFIGSRNKYNELKEAELNPKKNSKYKSRDLAIGRSPFNFNLRNDLKKIMGDNGILITPLLNSLIEKDLKEKGLL